MAGPLDGMRERGEAEPAEAGYAPEAIRALREEGVLA
jgi:hypothetical protein